MIPTRNWLSRYLATFLAVATSASLTGCESLGGLWPFDDNEEAEVEETSEQVLYRSAQSSLRSGNFTAAIEKLQALETRFPFGSYAEQAQLELIFAQYMAYDQDAAIRAADRFIRLHPQHASVDYAYYLRGLAQFESGRGYIDRIGTADVANRDMTTVEAAFADFNQLVLRYPSSDYAKDAQKRMVYLRNLLAESELGIADFYMRRGGFVAAANRARFVVENYPGAPSTPDALVIMIEANHRLGLKDAANDALRILAANYPNHSGFDDDGNFLLEEVVRNRDRSWINILTFGLLDRPAPPPPIQIRQPTSVLSHK
ncbi:MAG: outer membrane protein assembly factor BamD [Gammaproteobacteria bacterium]|nr:outer membrane protein assembly factor BamD [Gammaproteobacteria bacterium]MCY4198930.1 outer membrane protein assembly factor BamD [Gammaproteobacteria bacterium]